MSIIYNALKRIESKTKNTEENSSSPKRNNRKHRRIIYILGFLIILVFIALFWDNPSTEKPLIDKSLIPRLTPQEPSGPKKKKKLPSQVRPISAPTGNKLPSAKKIPPFFLNGIFFSDDRYLALINDRVVKVGDFIEGAKVVKIDSNGVEIEFKDSFFRLEYP